MEQPTQEGQLSSITWEAPEHHHVEKSGEWFAILAIITLSAAAAAFAVGNAMFGMVIIVFAIVASLGALRAPKNVTYAVTSRGIQIDGRLYPFTTLESYFVEEEDINGPQLLVRSQKMTMPMLVIPLPEDEIDDIEELVAARLPEEHLEEPFFTKLLEMLGF